MKSYTNIEQSKKLAEILPKESADMYYFTVIHDYPYSQGKIKTIAKIMDGSFSSDYDTPCWSLAALLQVLPLRIYDELDDRDYELKIDMADKMPRYVRLGDLYHDDFPYDFEKDTLLDNVVESIIWLKDNNYF